jgi:hypothetical protein
VKVYSLSVVFKRNISFDSQYFFVVGGFDITCCSTLGIVRAKLVLVLPVRKCCACLGSVFYQNECTTHTPLFLHCWRREFMGQNPKISISDWSELFTALQRLYLRNFRKRGLFWHVPNLLGLQSIALIKATEAVCRRSFEYRSKSEQSLSYIYLTPCGR